MVIVLLDSVILKAGFVVGERAVGQPLGLRPFAGFGGESQRPLWASVLGKCPLLWKAE